VLVLYKIRVTLLCGRPVVLAPCCSLATCDERQYLLLTFDCATVEPFQLRRGISSDTDGDMRLLTRAAGCLLLLEGGCHAFVLRQGGTKRFRQGNTTCGLSPSINFGADDGPNGCSDHRPTRRDVIVASMAGLTAEAAWRRAVETAALALDGGGSGDPLLPKGTVEQLESGRAVVVPNWISLRECEELRSDIKQCFEGGHFSNFILSRNPNQADKAANDRWIMNSYSKSTKKDGPFADPTVGNFAVRQNFKARMASVKAYLSRELQDRPTLSADIVGSHEMEYLRYGAGALLQRHTDEHHVELQRPNGSRLPKKPNATRRSVTWMVYVNDDWNGETDGGHLRLHERAKAAAARVGSRGQDLQIGWLKATSTDGEQPVFLDPLNEGPPNENCVVYVVDDSTGAKRRLSSKPFANAALYLGGGDNLARKLMVEDPEDAKRFHLVDAPKSAVSSFLPPAGDAGEDGGERIRDIEPKAGTLVMFDSVCVPHEVMLTKKERYGIQGWFHEELGYQV